jgi:type I restriction enzyme, S subunit
MSSNLLPSHWVSARMREVVRKLVDGSHNPPEKKSIGFPMLSAINVARNQIMFSTYRLIDCDAFDLEDRRTNI